MYDIKQRALTLVAVLAMAVAGCSGGQGAQGPVGPQGDTGPKGDPGPAGVAAGTIAGSLTYLAGATSTPASAVTVATEPSSGVTATSDQDGNYQLDNVPVGVYTVVFSGNGYTTAKVTGVSVVAGKTATVAPQVLVATNPLTVVSTTPVTPAGFGKQVTLGVTVTPGGSYKYTYKQKSGPTTIAGLPADPVDAASASFTTGTFAEILAAQKVIGLGQGVGLSSCATCETATPRAGFVAVSAQQLAQMTYSVDVTVTDTASGWTKTVTIAVPVATLAQGSSSVPVTSVVIGNLPGNAAPVAFTAPNGSSAVLNDASTSNPWFIPDVPGDYTIAGLPKVTAGTYVSASKTCGTCHPNVGSLPALDGFVQAKFTDWQNSAHGNHFFKYSKVDAAGKLTWNAGVTAVPTANPGVMWSTADIDAAAAANPGLPMPMTTFEFGMTGAEGTHYGQNCMGCHTTGYNAAESNGGMYDQMKASSWAFPSADMAKVWGPLMVNSKADTADYVTPKPEATIWNGSADGSVKGIPAAVKAYAGMQCESCHGPLGQHVTQSAAAPKTELDPAACAVCHDKPTNHDRVALWRQSKHSNLQVAVDEAGGGSNSCNRCHSAQGFVKYVAQLKGELLDQNLNPYKDANGKLVAPFGGVLLNPTTNPVAPAAGAATVTAADAAYLATLGITPATVQPQTCGACHDPHTSEVRVLDDTGNLPAGFRVQGAGSGALCFVCHNSRNGARGDGLNGVFYNNDLPGATPVALNAIGGPHEANQGDVLVGANAFWMPQYSPSRHMAVTDTCVGCHMKIFPAGMSGTNTNHTWKIDSTACAKCHGAQVDGEALQAQFEAQIATLLAKLTSVASAPITNKTFAIKGYNKTASKASTVIVTPDNVKAITFITGRSVGFKIDFNNAIVNPGDNTAANVTTLTVSLGNADGKATALWSVLPDGVTLDKAIFAPTTGIVAKANWNYSLAEQDGSKSIHNPTFVFTMMSNTLGALNAGGTL